MSNILTIDGIAITTPILVILKKLQSQLLNGKLQTIEDKQEYIKVTCPSHSNGHESHPSCSVYTGSGEVNYGTFNCLACGEKGPFEKFVALCLDSSVSEAKKWLKDNFGEGEVKPYMTLDRIVLPRQVEKKKCILSLDRFESFHPYMKKRHLTDEVIRDFQIMYDPEYKAIVFPVKDKNGDIIAFTRRTTEGKKFYIDKDFDKSNLYAIDKAKNCDTITLVESQLNCLSLWGWGKPALATFGCGCPDNQIAVLNSLPARHYIIAFDNDEAGKHGTLRLCQKLSKTKLVDVVIFNDNRDVNDLTKEEFESLKVIDRAQYKFTNCK